MIKKFMDKLAKVLEYATAIALLGLIVAVVFQMLGRWCRFTNVAWTDEVVTCMTTWMVFMGSTYLAERDGHVSITMFTEKLNATLQKVLKVIIQLMNLVCGGFVVFSSQLWIKASVGKLTAILQIEYNIWYTAVLVFGILFSIFSLYKLCTAIGAVFGKDTPEA